MIKNYYILLVLFLSMTAYSQKNYDFDYVMEYKDISKAQPEYYFIFTNSKDNSYALTIWEKDNLNFNMHFFDHEGISARTTINKADFYEVEAIGIKCDLVHKFINKDKDELIKNNDFVILKDTIINTQPHKYYMLKQKNYKKAGKHAGDQYYIVQNNTDFHLPLLLSTTAYEEWTSNGNIPNGIFMHSYMKKPNGKIENNMVLLQYAKMKKIFIIDDDCK